MCFELVQFSVATSRYLTLQTSIIQTTPRREKAHSIQILIMKLQLMG